jgi:hypothetical protein
MRTPSLLRCVAGIVAGVALLTGQSELAAQGRPADPATGWGITSVAVFANSAMVIQGAQARAFPLTVHRMDQLEQLTHALNQQMPRGGEAEVRRWLAAHAGRIQQQVRPTAIAAANAVSMAHYYRLDRLPAIVINRSTVVP